MRMTLSNGMEPVLISVSWRAGNYLEKRNIEFLTMVRNSFASKRGLGSF